MLSMECILNVTIAPDTTECIGEFGTYGTNIKLLLYKNSRLRGTVDKISYMLWAKALTGCIVQRIKISVS